MLWINMNTIIAIFYVDNWDISVVDLFLGMKCMFMSIQDMKTESWFSNVLMDILGLCKILLVIPMKKVPFYQLILVLLKSNPSKREVFGRNLVVSLAHILMGILSGCKLQLTLHAKYSRIRIWSCLRKRIGGYGMMPDLVLLKIRGIKILPFISLPFGS